MIDIDHVGIEAVLNEVAGFIKDIGDATGHPGTEIAPGGTEVDHHATGHVFEGVVTEALDDGFHSGVADAETLTCHAGNVGFTGSGAIEADVAGDDIFVRNKG